MNERTTLEIIAPTVEEALSQGLTQLGLTADKVSVEVLDAGNKGLFGLGKPQVRVRLTVISEGGTAAVDAKPAVREVEARPAVQTKARPVDQTPVRPDPVKETESKPDHDFLLDHTEVVISRLIHLLHLQAQVSAHYGEQDREGRRDIHVDIFAGKILAC
jgi:spoIIIJ-associated protein